MPKKPPDHDDIAHIIGKNLRAARQRRGLTQAQVAEAVNTGESFYGRIERGGSCGSIEMLVAIADVLDISMDEVFGEAIAHGPRPSSLDALPPQRHTLAARIIAMGHKAVRFFNRAIDFCERYLSSDDQSD